MRIQWASAFAMVAVLTWGCVPSGGGGGGGDDDDGPGSQSGAGSMNGGGQGGLVGLGGPCAASQDCQSGQCVEVAGTRVCSQNCGGAEDCPTGFLCQFEHCVPDLSAGGMGGGIGSGGNMMGPRGGAMGPGGGMMGSGGGMMGSGGGMMGSGGGMMGPGGGMMSGGGEPGMGDGLLCGERDPGFQCRVACVRAVQCLTEFCPHAPPDGFVGLCQESCPNEGLVQLVCDDDRECDSVVANLTAADELINSACYEGPCQPGDCGARGRCVDGLCECSQGYTGTRCETAPTVEQLAAICQAYIACGQACDGDEACQAACENAQPTGAGLYNALVACALGNNCVDPDGNADEECIRRLCRPQLEACFGP